MYKYLINDFVDMILLVLDGCITCTQKGKKGSQAKVDVKLALHQTLPQVNIFTKKNIKNSIIFRVSYRWFAKKMKKLIGTLFMQKKNIFIKLF